MSLAACDTATRASCRPTGNGGFAMGDSNTTLKTERFYPRGFMPTERKTACGGISIRTGNWLPKGNTRRGRK
ncbi:Uncharacterised protein [Burkholderia pseudomallei]|nr:Uncharacterised protein [Burkholderia pseudomallei]VCJ93247.1 Uncharacterised protein [Burkholderia pseudomallei]VCJ94857.1 Uncharacterised protein [Burkholderia pseudomallei]VCJ97305.1 Uncharacterised protein [Burkholderia pseudomallei]VCJ97587.1 Uncharacterised protein [Burkholderia pseudomallei]